MGIAPVASKITLPERERPYPSLLEFLRERFPRVPGEIWDRRLAEGKLLDEDGRPVGPGFSYQPQRTIYYFREVAEERVIPFSEEIIYRDEHLLVCCKPHFLPMTPTGRFAEQCLLSRLQRRTGLAHLAPLHRLDRATAGVVMFSTDPTTAKLYSRLFFHGKIRKQYHAVAPAPKQDGESSWRVENRIEPGEPWFRMRVVPGAPNSVSRIEVVERQGDLALFRLSPLTGKTHQLRLHMSGLGFPILNDRLYPDLLPQQEDDFERPLQLLAHTLSFEDPLSGVEREFVSTRRLCAAIPTSRSHPL
ncbi:pseudouridine synthase [Geomesophilobacter sediminis]|uniref:Pseudouridine synthase n=1 Tax=Geomesophilobacter sediminis TaxID=2798584 RepID=A0A8J7LVP1_9BACT|nr:pseudouridine synthase [Geomesophilobacter sediminis]MBJ6725744.1 pseudouridine synthase [Geomesophilobacter sediminis]